MNISIHQDAGRPLEAKMPTGPIMSGGKWSIAVDLVEQSGQYVTIFFHDPEQARAIAGKLVEAAKTLDEKLVEDFAMKR